MTTTPSDPRSVVTPDAFEVSSELLGLPLAPPRRRFWAILIDGVVIGIVTLLTLNFALVLGAVAAVAFTRAGFKRTPVRGGVFGRAMRFSVGCLGVFIGGMTAILWAIFGIGFGPGGGSGTPSSADFAPAAAVTEEAPGARSATAEAPAELREEIEGYTTREALAAYAALLEGTDDTETEPRLALLRERLSDEIAADGLAELERTVDDLRARNERQADDLEEMSDALAEASRRGLFSRLMDFIDELGFGFGWASLYMTLALSAWNGQTVGKRALGIRVVRLDGGPITWWVAFERAGGYAAGFATGLLGFAQVFWDANRQAIHDRIVGTVVVVDGAAPVGSWESAL